MEKGVFCDEHLTNLTEQDHLVLEKVHFHSNSLIENDWCNVKYSYMTIIHESIV